MEVTLTTPAVLFPAISLLLLAYTNRFIALAQIIRNFDRTEDSDSTQKQIENLRERIQLIKRMQEVGVVSFFLCVLSMLVLYADYRVAGSWIFASSLIFLLYSLWLSVREIRISVEALDVYLCSLNLPFRNRKWTKSNINN
ncbi:DUF2721 domain-containing protein [Aestuariibacter sp. AA17]|uniref:DUF2721 domain-containing protein n=1 Tax=Fluctibacter corallii TaxID=2984329 RepID=A0ABT3A4V0_9ALTE|nr:DUF2721 domain-containing protein [Aestuariibacter sp. AA17]MCV2883706.1 DUF2721 domain-containing protein [Aestuariibacter sp. AA17]